MKSVSAHVLSDLGKVQPSTLDATLTYLFSELDFFQIMRFMHDFVFHVCCTCIQHVSISSTYPAYSQHIENFSMVGQITLPLKIKYESDGIVLVFGAFEFD